MKRSALLVLAGFALLTAQARAALAPPGSYEQHGHVLYVGVEHELPDPAQNQFFDPATQRVGTIDLRGATPRTLVHEERRLIESPGGRLGVSIYYRDRKKRAAIILVHGNDPETRDMGFIIPYFVLNGIDVISYDQRGTGESVGNWFLNGPLERARDVTTVYDALRSDPLVDSRRIGIYGFSNGGWTAPVVARRRPLAFMILKSGPAESLLSNIDYESTQEMARHKMSSQKTQRALGAWHLLESAIDGTQSWDSVKRAYAEAKAQSWFAYSLLPDIPIPPNPALRTGLRRFISFDPKETLQHVTTPTLALYGALDRKVDVADSSMRLQAYVREAGMRDFTMHVYPGAGHTLEVSDTGFDPVLPERYVGPFPAVMVSWLAERGFTEPASR